jgi:hypothetical protein
MVSHFGETNPQIFSSVKSGRVGVCQTDTLIWLDTVARQGGALQLAGTSANISTLGSSGMGSKPASKAYSLYSIEMLDEFSSSILPG